MKGVSLIVLVVTFLIKLRFNPTRSIGDIIRGRYGTPTLTTYRALERKKCKYEKAKADIDFLGTCRDNDIIPKFLNFKLYKTKLKSYKNTFKYRILIV